jgi:hypothetical protein
MCRGLMFCILFAISSVANAQEDVPKPKVSDAPLTSEQVAIYRAVLSTYLKGSDRVLNLANITELLDRTDTECFKGLNLEAALGTTAFIHRIGPELMVDKIVLVDPDRQQGTIKENDPEKLMRKVIDDHEQITDEQLDKSLERAFSSGLFTLSEIAFDKEHRRAVVSYGFVCGALCGHGNLLVLKKVGHNWKVSKRCGGWVS